jgi:hypothetical protein
MNKKLTAGVFAMICAGTAFGQSHSVTNYSNPPGTTAQSKAAVEATPSSTATAHQNSATQGDKNAGQAGKSKHVKAKKHATAKGAKTSAGTAAESAMETQPSEKSGSPTERAAFDSAPKSGK